MKIFILCIFFFSISFLNIYSQKRSSSTEKVERKDKRDKVKYPTYFGFYFRTLLPSEYVGQQSYTSQKDGFYSTFSQQRGMSFGATLRKDFHKRLAIESGIIYNKRNFLINSSVPDSNFYELNNPITFINYEIPFNTIAYIQLSEKIYTNVLMGGSFLMSPTEIRKHYYVKEKYNFVHSGQHIGTKYNFCLNAGVGFELRTEKNGFFYIGGTASIPIRPLFFMFHIYKNNESVITYYDQRIRTGFISIDLKYFFYNAKNKGFQYNKGPIE